MSAYPSGKGLSVANVTGARIKQIKVRHHARQFGESKLKIREMGGRYFFILLYCFIEKFFSSGDFKKKW